MPLPQNDSGKLHKQLVREQFLETLKSCSWLVYPKLATDLRIRLTN